MRKKCAALLLVLICAIGLAGKTYPQPARKQRPQKQPGYLYQVSTRDEKTGENRIGFIDNTGKLVIGFDRLPKETVGVEEFHEGRAMIFVKDLTASVPALSWRVGYIDETGALVIPAKFAIGRSFSEGLAYVAGGESGFRGFIDRAGQIAFRVDDPCPGDFHEGLAVVGGRRDSGYIDRAGRTVIKRQYEFADDFSEGLAGVVVGGKFGFIDRSGKMVIPPRFEPRRGGHGEAVSTSRFLEGRAPVSTELVYGFHGTFGYINRKGKFVIEPQFQTAQAFSEGLAFADIREGSSVKAGWINKSGSWVLTVKEQISDFGEFLRQPSASIDGRYRAGDTEYREGLVPFCDYSAEISITARILHYLCGYMDRTGKVVIEPRRLYGPGPFVGGIAKVYVIGYRGFLDDYSADDYGYIDRAGKFIWRSIPYKAIAR